MRILREASAFCIKRLYATAITIAATSVDVELKKLRPLGTGNSVMAIVSLKGDSHHCQAIAVLLSLKLM